MTNSSSSELTELALPISNTLDSIASLHYGSVGEQNDGPQGRKRGYHPQEGIINSEGFANLGYNLSLLFGFLGHTVKGNRFDIRDLSLYLGDHLASAIGL